MVPGGCSQQHEGMCETPGAVDKNPRLTATLDGQCLRASLAALEGCDTFCVLLQVVFLLALETEGHDSAWNTDTYSVV
jgi:hypothetical protein